MVGTFGRIRKIDLDKMKHSLNEQIHKLNNAIAETKTYEDELKLFDKVLGALLKNPSEKCGSLLSQLRNLRSQIERTSFPKLERSYGASQEVYGMAPGSFVQKCTSPSEIHSNILRNRRFGPKESEKLPLRDASLNTSGQCGFLRGGESGKGKAGRPMPVIPQHYQENY